MIDALAGTRVIDPMALIEILWPDTRLYDKQVETLYSVEDNYETYVPAANQMGKDFIAGLIALTYPLRYRALGNVKVVTTSVKEEHLDVLWGEMDRFIRTAKYPLTADKGGPLIYNYQELRFMVGGVEEKESYVKGMVWKKAEGAAGHHANKTLLIGDESSGLDDTCYAMGQGWAKRMLWLGNCNPTDNFFKRFVDAGDLLEDGSWATGKGIV